MTGRVISTGGLSKVFGSIPKKEPLQKKSYFQLHTPDGPSKEFIRHAYQLLSTNSSGLTLIHYVGNEKAAVDFPHGNQKQNKERGYTRTCPSVLRKLEDDCLTGTTSKIYKSAITNIPPSTHMTVLQPRNDKQVENIRTKQLQKHRISHDALYNLHEMAVDMPDFIQFVPTQIWYVSVVSERYWRN